MAKKRPYQGNMKEKNSRTQENYGAPRNKRKRDQGSISSQTKAENTGSFFIKPYEKKNELIHSQSSSTSKLANSEEKLELESSSKVDKTRQKMEGSNDTTGKKKPFDKKLYRLKKYSKKYKLQQWEEKKKQTLLRDYQRSIKNLDEPKLDVAKIYDEDDLDSRETETKTDTGSLHEPDSDPANLTKRKKTFLKPHERYQQIKDEKQKKKEEFLRRKKEREAAIKKAKKERLERNKKLSQKTRKGQPIMKYRIEMLLEKIENSLKNN